MAAQPSVLSLQAARAQCSSRRWSAFQFAYIDWVLSCALACPVSRAVDWDPSKVYSTMLTNADFDSFVSDTELTMVNFFAPWCHWCTRLVRALHVWRQCAILAASPHRGERCDPQAEAVTRCRLI